jgi:ParB family chromosome partitioning protein
MEVAMAQVNILDAARGERGGYKVDVNRGERIGKAQDLLAGSGWLPEPLRTFGRAITTASAVSDLPSESPVQFGGEESTSIGGETAVVDFKILTEDKAAAIDPHTIAAE